MQLQQPDTVSKKDKELKKIFKDMFNAQMKLNNDINGEDWIRGKTNLGKKINWFRCVYMEASELIALSPWKHWTITTAEPKYDLAKIKIVDIWHFFMSQMIKDLGVESATLKALADYDRFMKKIIKDQSYRRLSLIEATEELMVNALVGVLNTVDFFKVIYKIETFSIEEVYTLYLGKNCLNQFRQENGYKIGTYKKMWGEKEDNAVLNDILTENINITYKELYAKLSQQYTESLKTPKK